MTAFTIILLCIIKLFPIVILTSLLVAPDTKTYFYQRETQLIKSNVRTIKGFPNLNSAVLYRDRKKAEHQLIQSHRGGLIIAPPRFPHTKYYIAYNLEFKIPRNVLLGLDFSEQLRAKIKTSCFMRERHKRASAEFSSKL